VPVAIADGALGLEALHTWTPPQGIVSGGIPTFTLNNRASLTALLTADGYAVKVKSITGLHSLPDLIDEREAALGRIGEVVYDAEDSGKTVVYSGTIYGSTLQKLREGSNAMRRTFQAKSREAGAVHRLAQVGEGMMTIAPHASYGSVQHVFFGRTQSLEMGDEQTAPPSSTYGPYLRPFVLTIRMADPRVYEATVQSTTGGNLDGSSVFITNSGSAPTEPVFKLHRRLHVHSRRHRPRHRLRARLHGARRDRRWLWVDFKARRAWLEHGGVRDDRESVGRQSNWWDPGVHGLDPGPNDIGVTGIGTRALGRLTGNTRASSRWRSSSRSPTSQATQVAVVTDYDQGLVTIPYNDSRTAEVTLHPESPAGVTFSVRRTTATASR
jgi:hypothetical protein